MHKIIITKRTKQLIEWYLSDELWWLSRWFFWRRSSRKRSSLKSLQLFSTHALWKLRVKVNCFPRAGLQGGFSCCSAPLIGSSAHELSRVPSIGMSEVKNNESKVIKLMHTRSCGKWSPIPEPVNAHGWVTCWFYPAVKVSWLTLFKVQLILKAKISSTLFLNLY